MTDAPDSRLCIEVPLGAGRIAVLRQLLADLPPSRAALADLPEIHRKPKRVRKPSVSTLIKQAERAGKIVTSVTRDGVKLDFGQPESVAESNPWLADLKDKVKQ